MFLVADRIDRSRLEPVLWRLRDVLVRHPARLSIPYWDIRAGEMWLIAGTHQLLECILGVLRETVEYSADGAFAGKTANVAFVGTSAPEARPGLWRRLLNRLRPPKPAEPGEDVRRWLHDLPPGDGEELEILKRLEATLAGDHDVIVLDEIVYDLRPQVRFRVSADLQERCNSEGLTVIALTDSGLEGWIAGDRCATLRSGVFEQVQRRDLDDFI